MNNPIEQQFGNFLGSTEELPYSQQVKSAIRDPQLNRSLVAALKDIRDKPGTNRFHVITGDLFAFNVGLKGGRGLVARTAENKFDLVGVTSNHSDYEKIIEQMRSNGLNYKADRRLTLTETLGRREPALAPHFNKNPQKSLATSPQASPGRESGKHSHSVSPT